MLQNPITSYQRGSAKQIADSARKLKSLTEDLLMMTKLSRIKNPYEKINIRSLITSAMDRLETQIKENKVKMSITDNLPVVMCDRIKMTEVFYNLLSNAVDAIDTLESGKQKWVSIEITDKEGFVRISVANSGPEIDGELRKKISQPFFTTKPKGKGTGIGLTISHRILTAHNGKFSLDQKRWPTTFHIDLPKEKTADINTSD